MFLGSSKSTLIWLLDHGALSYADPYCAANLTKNAGTVPRCLAIRDGVCPMYSDGPLQVGLSMTQKWVLQHRRLIFAFPCQILFPGFDRPLGYRRLMTIQAVLFLTFARCSSVGNRSCTNRMSFCSSSFAAIVSSTPRPGNSVAHLK